MTSIKTLTLQKEKLQQQIASEEEAISSLKEKLKDLDTADQNVAVFLFVKSGFLGLSSFHPNKRISANLWLLHISEFLSHVLSGTFLCTLHLKIGNKLPCLHSTVRCSGSDR